MRDFLAVEIQVEVDAQLEALREQPAVQRACELYGIDVEEVLLGVRRHDVTRARHAATWLLHQEGMSLRELARGLGYADRTSVCAALRRVESDPAMRALLRGLEIHTASTASVADLALVRPQSHARLMPTKEPA
jgi:chromosomal replication initiation ATPase DnaA